MIKVGTIITRITGIEDEELIWGGLLGFWNPLGIAETKDEELMWWGLLGFYKPPTNELQFGRGKPGLNFNGTSKGSSSFSLSKASFSNNSSKVTTSPNSSLSSYDTRAEVSIPLLCKSEIISMSSSSFSDLKNISCILSSTFLSSGFLENSESKDFEWDGLPDIFENIWLAPEVVLGLSPMVGGLRSIFLCVYLLLESTFKTLKIYGVTRVDCTHEKLSELLLPS